MVFANVLVVQPALAGEDARRLREARASEKPGTVTYASSGIGGAGHLAGELLKMMAKIDIVHVPYKGGGPAMQGFLGKQVDSFFATPVSSIKQIQAGRARALATTGTKRAKLMPDVPTVAESGYPGYEALNWYAYLGPANTAEGHRRPAQPASSSRRCESPEVLARLRQAGPRAAARHAGRARALHEARVRDLGQGREAGQYQGPMTQTGIGRRSCRPAQSDSM